MKIKEAIFELYKKDVNHNNVVINRIYKALEYFPEEKHVEILINTLEQLIEQNNYQLELILDMQKLYPYPVRII